MNPVVLVILAAALLLVGTMVLGLVCSLTSEPQPQRHPSHGNTEEES